MLKLPNFCSIFSAKAVAISYALDLIKTRRISKALILSDSLSPLRSIENPSTTNEITKKIQNQMHNLTINTSYSTILIFIPSHSQFTGNEITDKKVRNAITSPDAEKLNCFTLQDAKSRTKLISNNLWLRAWTQGSSKLNEIKNTILIWPPPQDITRKIETSINRMRIGHTLLTHQYLMKKEDPPMCASCGTQLTIKHIISDCLSFETDKRGQEYQISSQKPYTQTTYRRQSILLLRPTLLIFYNSLLHVLI